MDIYLIRHGETEYNRQKRLQGVGDIPLNARGIELAEKTAEGLREISFDKIYTSPLIRAKKDGGDHPGRPEHRNHPYGRPDGDQLWRL